MKNRFLKICSIILIAMFVLSACAPAATQAPAAPEPTKAAAAEPTKEAAPEPTKAAEPTATTAAAASPTDYLSAAREDTFIVDQPYKLETFDNWNPYTSGNSNGWGFNEIGMDDLMYTNFGDGKHIMWMAEAVDSNPDATVWTLHLRKGITWNDGVPFTADDIVYTISIQQANDKLSNHFYWAEWLDKVEKVDDLTVKYTLKKTNVRFADERISGGLGVFPDIFIPKHIFEKVSDPTTFKNFDLAKGLPLGTGPYVLAKVTTNETVWVRNDNWWGAKTGFAKLPEPKKVVYSYVGTEEVRTQTAIDNGFDSMQDITPGALEAILAQNPKWEAFFKTKPYAVADPCARIISLNSAKKPWDDKDMRNVLSMVMDRKQIVDIAYEGSTTLAAYFWPDYGSMKPYSALVDPDVYKSMLTPQLDKAAEIMKAKGYVKGAKYWAKDGKDLGIEVQVPEDFIELIRVGDVWVEQLQKFGINATESKLGAVFYTNASNGDFEAQSNWFACGSVSEPWTTLNQFTGAAAPLGTAAKGGPIDNQWRWSNKEYSDIVAEIGTTKLDDPKLMDLTKKALAILYAELPAFPSAQSRKIVPFNYTYWTGFPTSDNYYIFPCNWCNLWVVAMTKMEKAKK